MLSLRFSRGVAVVAALAAASCASPEPGDDTPDARHEPFVFAGGQSFPRGLAHSSTITWAEGGRGRIQSCSFHGCNGAPTVLASGLDGPTSVELNGNAILTAWTNTGRGTVEACATSGCESPMPGVMAAGQGEPMTIVTDVYGYYWTNAGDGTVVFCSDLTGCGGSPNPIATGLLRPVGLAIHDGRLYWTDPVAGEVRSCARDGCGDAPTLVASGQDHPGGIAVAESGIYWVNEGAGTVMHCPLTDCATPKVLAAQQAAPRAIAVLDADVYWTNFGDAAAPGAVMRCRDGCDGAVETVAAAQPGALDLLLGRRIFWTRYGTPPTYQDGAVMALDL